ncbi:hypothetical protein TNCT_516111 [Trichonephila clavata]|uniref:Uncharacterized protein n=1 Tax=Trichonephila clavata TaxID=2740835 RepID=A0A8X6EY91_TRICU|nr:hypothetical protein TNCT_516111 [Trichonephila clavata]
MTNKLVNLRPSRISRWTSQMPENNVLQRYGGYYGQGEPPTYTPTPANDSKTRTTSSVLPNESPTIEKTIPTNSKRM